MEALKWPGGEHTFSLATIGDLRALQDACGSGPFAVFKRLQSGDWRVDDVTATIRLGLVGGGMEDKEAARLTANAATLHLLACAPVAAAVILEALTGPEDDEPGKPEAVETPNNQSE